MSSGVTIGGPNSPVNESLDYGPTAIAVPGTAEAVTKNLAAGVNKACTFVEVQVSELSARPITFGLSSSVKAGSAAAIANRVGVALFPGGSKIFYCTNAAQLYFDAENTADKFTFSIYR